MPVIGRARYINATEALFANAGFKVSRRDHRLMASKDSRLILTEVAGKNLPYLSASGGGCFEWETWIAPQRLDRLDAAATRDHLEPWLAYCYAILDEAYRPHFSSTVEISGTLFGARCIGTSAFRAHMIARSPSWGEVNLQRDHVLQLTRDPKSL
jgi:hypothetical protein